MLRLLFVLCAIISRKNTTNTIANNFDKRFFLIFVLLFNCSAKLNVDRLQTVDNDLFYAHYKSILFVGKILDT